MADDTIHRMFSAVAEEFRAELPGRLDAIDALWARIAGGEWSADLATELVRALHGIAGSAAIFKLPEVGKAAAAAEAALEAWRQAAAAPDADAQQAIAALIGELRNACGEVRG